ncbi:hypothetical protein ACS0TY_021672 [Phlomoides rotata]
MISAKDSLQFLVRWLDRFHGPNLKRIGRGTRRKGGTHLELVPPSRKRAEKVRSSAVLTITVTSRLYHSRTHLPCTTQASAKSARAPPA